MQREFTPVSQIPAPDPFAAVRMTCAELSPVDISFVAQRPVCTRCTHVICTKMQSARDPTCARHHMVLVLPSVGSTAPFMLADVACCIAPRAGRLVWVRAPSLFICGQPPAASKVQSLDSSEP
jgi:hypothetical protein